MLAGRVFKVAVNFLRGPDIAAVDFEEVLTRFHVDTRLCERRSELRVPVFAVENASKAIPSVFDFVVGAKQPALDLAGLGAVAAADEHVADRDLSEHLLEEIVEVSAAAQAFEVHAVLFLGGRNVEAVMIRVVEEVAFDAPDFAIHLVPFDARIDVNLHAVELERAIAGFRGLRGAHNEPASALPVESFFAIGGDDECHYAANERLCLARAEFELRNTRQVRLSKPRHIGNLAQE